jgi:hypothetical protein
MQCDVQIIKIRGYDLVPRTASMQYGVPPPPLSMKFGHCDVLCLQIIHQPQQQSQQHNNNDNNNSNNNMSLVLTTSKL